MDHEEKVFIPPDVHQPSHLVSDLHFWKNQYKLLANASNSHHSALKKAMDKTDKYLVRLKQTGDLGEEERGFFKEVRLYQEILRHQMEKLQQDAHVYYDLEKDLKRYSDDPSLKIEKLDNAYKLAREKLATQTKVVEDIKKAYHKSMFGMEKAEISGMLAIHGYVAYDVRNKLEDLEAKADKQVNSYDRQLDKWHKKMDRLQQMSKTFEANYLEREEARAVKVLSLLQKSIELTNATLSARREPDFTGIDGKAIILEKVIKHEQIIEPSFEEYVPQEDTSDMYAMARAEVDPEVTKQVAAKSLINLRDMDDTDQDATTESKEDTIAGNRRLKMLRKIRVYLVIKEYKKQRANQINLKFGEFVRQILPENEDGFAFGLVDHGLLHKKKKGFYPASHVKLVETDDCFHGNAKDVENTESDKQTAKCGTNITPSNANGGNNYGRNDYSTEPLRNKKQRKLDTPNNDNNACRMDDYNDDASRDSKSPEEKGESASEKKKKGVFNSIARKLRRKKKDNKADIVVEIDLDEAVPSEPENVVTAVQAFVAEPDSDDEDFDVSRRRKPKMAFQEPEPDSDDEEFGRPRRRKPTMGSMEPGPDSDDEDMVIPRRRKPKMAFQEPESNSDDKGIVLPRGRKPKLAFQEIGEKKQPLDATKRGNTTEVQGNANARQRRRENAYKT